MIKVVSSIFLGVLILVLTGCSTSSKAVSGLHTREKKLQKKIEENTQKQYSDEKFLSIGFGPMNIYKPDSFIKLDSLYAVKQAYLNANDLEGLNNSGIEELIPSYREEANKDIDKVKYEIEHIFQTERGSNVTIHHEYTMYNGNEELISVTPFYKFSFPKSFLELYYAYEFRLHFVDNWSGAITTQENEFISFFKAQEIRLIGEEKLEEFMNHTFLLMYYATQIRKLDFSEISKLVAANKMAQIHRGESVVIESFGTLFSYKTKEVIDAYEMEVLWMNEITQEQYKTTFFFTPYLEIVKENTEMILKD